MNPHQVIQQINQAMANDDLEAAEKALEEYVIAFDNWRKKDQYGRAFSGYAIEPMTGKQLYQLFTNQS